MTLHLRLENAAIVYVRYISKIFWPTDLALIYPYHTLAGRDGRRSRARVASCGRLFSLAYPAKSILAYRLVLGFWGTLVPTIGLVQVGVQSMADRYLDLPGIGLFILIAWGLNDLVNSRPGWRKPVTAACGLALAGCLVVTELQLSFWRNSLAIFSHTVEVTTDNYAAYVHLGNLLEKPARRTRLCGFT